MSNIVIIVARLSMGATVSAGRVLTRPRNCQYWYIVQSESSVAVRVASVCR